MVPENTRTRLTLPTYGSDVVFTTSASSGPAGSQAGDGRVAPAGVNTAGVGCSGGEGKPLTMTSNSSAVPTPVVLHTGSTGKNEALATAFSRSSVSTDTSTSSPSR